MTVAGALTLLCQCTARYEQPMTAASTEGRSGPCVARLGPAWGRTVAGWYIPYTSFMCARFVSRVMAALERGVQARWHDPFELIYNAAPSMQLSVVTAGPDGAEARAMKWGFIPGWWKQAKPPKLTLNTRSEAAAQ